MLEISDYSITLTCGDSAVINFNTSGAEIESGDHVYFTVRTAVDAKTAVIEKELVSAEETEDEETDNKDTYILTLDPVDTKDLAAGTYYWDVRVYFASGDVDTPIRPQKLTLLQAVTRKDNE